MESMQEEEQPRPADLAKYGKDSEESQAAETAEDLEPPYGA